MIGQSLSSYAFVPREYAAESLVAHNFAFAGRTKLRTQNLVPDVLSLMRSLVVVIRHPFLIDIVELIKAKAKDNGKRQQTVSEPHDESLRDATAKQGTTLGNLVKSLPVAGALKPPQGICNPLICIKL